MASDELDTLGRILMKSVRDESISDLRMVLSGVMKGDIAERIRAQLKSLDAGALAALQAVLPDFVDQVIHNFLVAVEQSPELELVVSGAKEVRASEESDGLAGELYGSRGWIARFSRP